VVKLYQTSMSSYIMSLALSLNMPHLPYELASFLMVSFGNIILILLLFPTPICPWARQFFYCYVQRKPYRIGRMKTFVYPLFGKIIGEPVYLRYA
jgi:hypothetical protein